ncbi:uncharacterized protein LOC127131803 [Lathyrus oleraceus]|uniref:uncharacterized protein LOC127131803 n=1 Tax=Pisum sativum TaxID=3888 RepID=UPI0021D269DD|nr:uncharacterized protein LOC127131803 [Pisum sativum]
MAFYIQSKVDTTNFYKISHVESAKKVCDILVKYYEGGKKVNIIMLQTLQRQYELLSMGENKKICHTNKLKNKVPKEVWSGKRPSVDHLKVFGSMCYTHVPDARKRKLDDKSEPMNLVGYHKIGAYRLFNPINHKIMISRYIVIDEKFAWDWNSSNAIDKPLMSYDFDEASNDVKVEDIIDIPVEVEVVADIPDTVKVGEVMTSTSQKPQRTQVRLVRLQDYEVVGDDEVTTDGELVHFSLLAGGESINYMRL